VSASAVRERVVVVDRLSKRFRGRHGQADVLALDDVSLEAFAGSTLGLVGESGSGKSTLARCVLALERPDSGSVRVLDLEMTRAGAKELRAARRNLQVVFQEPQESLDPRIRVEDAIAEPLLLHTELRGAALHERVVELLELVSLSAGLCTRYPHQLSGGQQQRVNIARALSTSPKVVVLDEPTSSLDVSVRAEILDLLTRLQRELGMAYILISHDLLTVRNICDTVGVMCSGRLVELGPTAKVLGDPMHPYTRLLLDSELVLDIDTPRRIPRLAEPQPQELGERHCVFCARCPDRIERCAIDAPVLEEIGGDHAAACFVAQGRI
jgi:oligopeptide/dipeptide ABC transporter ATP-binding protein